MIKKIIQIGDSRLLEESEEVEANQISNGEIQELGQDILDTTKFHVNSAAGLSAVQIGVLKRMYVVKRTDLEESSDIDQYELLINPEITYMSKEKEVKWEGCMSISDGDQRLFGPVERSRVVEIEYLKIDGSSAKMNAEGFFSHLIQHEQDHLNGILFLTYIDNPKNIWKEDELDDYLNKHQEFPPIVK
jgi:peptide deformylase